MRRVIGVTMLGLIGVFAPRAAEAEPIPVISGFVTIPAFDTFATFSLAGVDGSRLEGRWPAMSSGPCRSCRPGSVADPDARVLYDNVPFVFGDPFASGSAAIGGVTYPFLFFSGILEFSGGAFVLPETSGIEQIVEFTTPFAFTGEVSGYDRLLEGPRELYPLFTTDWTGAGTARLRFADMPFAPGGAYLWLGTTYEFEPVPEPATLLLTASGLSALVAVRRRRR